LAQLFFLTTVSLAVFTSRSWLEPAAGIRADREAVSLRALGVLALSVILIQLVLGATLRHSAAWDRPLPSGLLLAHIGGAVMVTLFLGITVLTILARYRSETYLTKPALISIALLTVQLALGIAAYITRLGSPNGPQPLNPMISITVAHVACGALVFASTIVLTLRVFRILRVERTAYILAPAA